MVTFAPAADFPSGAEIADSQSFAIADMLDRSLPIPDEELHQLRRSFVRLLGLSLEKRIREAHLGSYELANGKLCWFFLKPQNEDALKVHFDGIEGTRDWRALTGFATIASQRDKIIEHEAILALCNTSSCQVQTLCRLSHNEPCCIQRRWKNALVRQEKNASSPKAPVQELVQRRLAGPAACRNNVSYRRRNRTSKYPSHPERASSWTLDP